MRVGADSWEIVWIAPANDVGISVSNRLNADVVTRLSH
jgi:hypothetical protein